MGPEFGTGAGALSNAKAAVGKLFYVLRLPVARFASTPVVTNHGPTIE